MGDSVGVAAGPALQFGTAGRRLGGDDRVLDAGSGQRSPVPPRAVEAESDIIGPMRFLRVVLALVFGLAMAGPETHACPVHSGTSAPAHHQDGGKHQKAGQCTCPQACCPAGVSVSIPTTVASWPAAPLPAVAVDVAPDRATVLPSRK